MEDRGVEREPCSWMLQSVRVVRTSDGAEWCFPASFQTIPVLLEANEGSPLEETALFVDLQVPQSSAVVLLILLVNPSTS